MFKYITTAIILFVFCNSITASEKYPLGYYRSKGLYVQGAEHCEKLLSKNPDKKRRRDILLELAACYQFNTRDHTYEKAVSVYKNFLKSFAGDPACAKVWFNIGRCYDSFTTNREADIAKARAAYRACFGKYPDSRWAQHAFFCNAESYAYVLNEKNAAQAAKLLEEFLQKYPDSFLTGVVHSQLSEYCCAWLGKYKDAVKHSEAALEFGITDITVKRLHLYRIAYLYQFKLNDNESALKWYRRLVAESPTKTDPNYFVAVKRILELEENINRQGAKTPRRLNAANIK